MLVRGYVESITFAVYFGRVIGESGYVSDSEFDDFITRLGKEVPNFSLERVRQYWNGKLELTSKLSVTTSEFSAVTLSGTLKRHAKRYSDMFSQQSVVIICQETHRLHVCSEYNVSELTTYEERVLGEPSTSMDERWQDGTLKSDA